MNHPDSVAGRMVEMHQFKLNKIGEPTPQPADTIICGAAALNRGWRKSRIMSAASRQQPPRMIVTGKVNYDELLQEQRDLTAAVQESDIKYKAMIRNFETIQQTISKRFAVILDTQLQDYVDS
eukprot:NODE_6837_length_496_cov_12.560976_g6671_i0.p1 GENE.NODE_6837_length_496_cov_12.560976_g6671_i0~~NODE_6837_length_496_cov_12.560976_g6671_i0.p1  ORF type:complete len:123 (-),score=26.64 NODE_6837_length_496_cov_12.560976_g6671_i0:50-418(-)